MSWGTCSYSFFVSFPSDKRTTMLGRSRQSEPGAVGMCLIRASTRGAISLQMWSLRMGWYWFPRIYGKMCLGRSKLKLLFWCPHDQNIEISILLFPNHNKDRCKSSADIWKLHELKILFCGSYITDFLRSHCEGARHQICRDSWKTCLSKEWPTRQCYSPSAGSVTQAQPRSSSLPCGGRSLSQGGLTVHLSLLLFAVGLTLSTGS